MSQSEILSNSLNQHKVKNIESRMQDESILNISFRIHDEMKSRYPEYIFGIDTEFQLTGLLEIINSDIYVSDKSYFKPDGGLLWIQIYGKKYFYLFPEQKRQGTNDKRLMEGKNKQPQGNASERIADKLCIARLLFGDYDIFPFVTFLQGCDFYEPESTIPDRIKRTFNFLEPNVIHNEWIQTQKNNKVGGSYFMRGHSMKEVPGTSDWTNEEMYEIMNMIANQSIKYYIKNYGHK